MRDDAEVSLGRIEAALSEAPGSLPWQGGDNADGNQRHKEGDGGNE
jgi:hypothetical protein